jgi:hypothetical protein
MFPRGKKTDGARCPVDGIEVMELWLGPLGSSAFADREKLRAAWESARGYMLRVFGRPGRRPRGWWEFDTDLAYPGYDQEQSFLYEHGQLDAEECTQLEAIWRREYERSLKPGFSIAMSPEVILHGVRARRSHWLWADIPPSLLEAWEAERQPRDRKRTGAPLAGGAGPLNAEAPK